MAAKYNTIIQLIYDTEKRITCNGDEWKEFLCTAGNLCKYPFREQIQIYAQRPDAAACASIEIWNRRMNCWVNRGAKGIALIDEDASRPRLKYVFDISDVHKARRIGRFPYFWRVRPEQEQAVMERLFENYRVEKKVFTDYIKELSRQIAKECYEDTRTEMQYLLPDSYLEELDEYNLAVRIRETMAESTAYTILSGCGMDMEYLDDEFSFEFIHEFNTTAVLSLIGDSINVQVKTVMQEIRRAVRACERQAEKDIQMGADNYLGYRKKELANGIHMDYNALKRKSEEQIKELEQKEGSAGHGIEVQAGGGLSDTGYRDGRAAGGGASKIRKNEKEIPEGAPERILYRSAAVKQADEPSVYAPGAGRGKDGEDRGADGGERGSGRSVKSAGSDAVGAEDGRYQALGGGNRAGRDGLQLDNEEQKPDRESVSGFSFVASDETEPEGVLKKEDAGEFYGQLSFLPGMEEQAGNIAATEAGMRFIMPGSFFVQKEDLEEILRMGGGRKDSRFCIYAGYQQGKSREEMAVFLQKE